MCVRAYGRNNADRVAVLDTVEVIYLERRDDAGAGDADGDGENDAQYQDNDYEDRGNATAAVSAIGVHQRLLDDMEARSPGSCLVSLPWRTMYGEHHVSTQPDELLLDSCRTVGSESGTPPRSCYDLT